MQMLTVFWGDKFKDWFIKGCLETLSLGSNKGQVQGATWNIYTDEKFFGEIADYITHRIPGATFKLIPATKLRRYRDPIQGALVNTIETCLQKNEPMFLAPPDHLFSKDFIRSLKAIGYQDRACVASPHVRVNPSLLSDVKTITPKEAWPHLHKSWAHAERGHECQSSFIGGVTWQKVRPDLITVSHLLPTVFYAQFTVSDLDYFKACTSFGDWDHVWASKLIEEDRLRVAASSDIAFTCEVTDPEQNVPPYNPSHPKDGSFWINHPHNKMNKNIITTFRL